MRTLFISIAAAAALAAGAAHAEDGVMRVHVSDLDLSRPSDVGTAMARIRSATRDYCAPQTAYPIGGHMDRCKRIALENATRQLAVRQAAVNSRVANR